MAPLCTAIIILSLAVTAVTGAARPADNGGPDPSPIYLPMVSTPWVLPPPLPPPVAVSSTVPVDFEVVRAELEDIGKELGFVKIGFHVGMGGNIEGLFEYMEALDAAGVPFFLKTAFNAEPVYFAQQLRAASGVPHVLVYRAAGVGWDVPHYHLPPQVAAQLHWDLHRDAFPPELDPSVVWIETINEVDKNRAEWLAHFALETAHLALADGFRWAAFGWSTGEPEREHWELPAMRQFLQLAAAHPDRLAIALHEYSLELDDIGNFYPYLIGRFQMLFDVCDQYEIQRPTVLITEWGWTHNNVPLPEQALLDIAWASWLYAAYPQVKGAAIWYLGGGFDGIADQAQKLIAPLQEYATHNYFIVEPGIGAIDPGLFQP
jgi:hypothetical protein